MSVNAKLISINPNTTWILLAQAIETSDWDFLARARSGIEDFNHHLFYKMESFAGPVMVLSDMP